MDAVVLKNIVFYRCFLRQQATVNLDEKYKFGIRNEILLQRGCEERLSASVYHCDLLAFSRGRKLYALPLKLQKQHIKNTLTIKHN